MVRAEIWLSWLGRNILVARYLRILPGRQGEADNELSETEPEKIPLDQKGQGDCRVTEYFLEIGDRRYELTTLLTSFED